MIKASFERFKTKKSAFKKNASFPGVKLNSASDFLYLTDFDFFAEAYNHKTNSVEHKLIHNLLYRRLLKRVLTISSQTMENFDSDDEQKASYGNFYNLRKAPEQQRELAKKIHLDSKVDCSDLEVWFDLPNNPTFEKAGHARINTAPRGEPPILTKLSKFIPVKEWVDTYRQYYAQSFLFGPPGKKDRLKLALRARLHLKEKFGITLTHISQINFTSRS